MGLTRKTDMESTIGLMVANMKAGGHTESNMALEFISTAIKKPRSSAYGRQEKELNGSMSNKYCRSKKEITILPQALPIPTAFHKYDPMLPSRGQGTLTSK